MRSLSLSILLLVSILCGGCSLVFESYKPRIDGEYIPKNLEDALKVLQDDLSDSTRLAIGNMTEDEFSAQMHFGSGLYMRNNWGLWKGSRLSRYFNRKGIYHPDDMSGIILTSFYREIKNQDLRLNEQIKYYQDYWIQTNEWYAKAEIPDRSEHPEEELEFSYTILYSHDEVRSQLHLQTNSATDSIWIYDYLYGWAKIGPDLYDSLNYSSHKDRPQIFLDQIFNQGKGARIHRR